MRQRGLLASLVLLVGGGVVAACSNSDRPFTAGGHADAGAGGRDTDGAAATDTGGSRQADGGNDDGGDADGHDGGPAVDGGGPSPTAECVRDSDCIALTCNGAPRCGDGKCSAGLPCENPDPEHCTVSCERDTTRATCVVAGKDEDGDGHLDALCAGAKGDDCDDHTPTVYTGATEQCDGVDNDCDGKVDLDDSLPLGGTPSSLSEIGHPASLGMVASPNGYAILKIERDGELLFSTFDTDITFTDAAGRGTRTVRPAGDFTGEATIALTGKTVGVLDANTRAPDGPTNLLRVPLDITDAPREPMTWPKLSETGRAFTQNAADAPVAVFTLRASSSGFNGALFLQRIGELNTKSDIALPVVVTGTKQLFRPAIAAGASDYGVTWIEASGPTSANHQLTVHFAVMGSDLIKRSEAFFDPINQVSDSTYASALRDEAVRPQVVAAGKDYVAGWFNDDGLRFVRISKDATTVCQTDPIAGAWSWGWANSMVSDGKTVYAAVVDEHHEPRLVRIDEACMTSGSIALAAADTKIAVGKGAPNGKPIVEVGHPVLARGADGHIAAAWVEEPASDGDAGSPSTSGPYHVMMRVMGDRLCND